MKAGGSGKNRYTGENTYNAAVTRIKEFGPGCLVRIKGDITQAIYTPLRPLGRWKPTSVIQLVRVETFADLTFRSGEDNDYPQYSKEIALAHFDNLCNRATPNLLLGIFGAITYEKLYQLEPALDIELKSEQLLTLINNLKDINKRITTVYGDDRASHIGPFSVVTESQFRLLTHVRLNIAIDTESGDQIEPKTDSYFRAYGLVVPIACFGNPVTYMLTMEAIGIDGMRWLYKDGARDLANAMNIGNYCVLPNTMKVLHTGDLYNVKPEYFVGHGDPLETPGVRWHKLPNLWASWKTEDELDTQVSLVQLYAGLIMKEQLQLAPNAGNAVAAGQNKET